MSPAITAEIAVAAEDRQAASDLAAANRDAVAVGCFGVPWIVVDGETYFGQDRLQLLERRLQTPVA